MEELKKRTCVACGSQKLCFGYLGTAANAFIPSGIFTIHGFRSRAYVCFDCGYVGQYISKEKMEKLKEKLKDRIGEEEE